MSKVYISQGSVSTILTTTLNSLPSTSLVASAGINNIRGGGGTEGAIGALLELNVTFGTNPAANSGVSVWILRSVDDGSTFEDIDSTTPARPYDAFFCLRQTTAAQKLHCEVRLPPGHFKVLIKNDATGQSFAASGNTLKLYPFNLELV